MISNRCVFGVKALLLALSIGCQGGSGASAAPPSKNKPSTAEAERAAAEPERVASQQGSVPRKETSAQPSAADPAGARSKDYHPAMLDPSQADQTAPEKYTARLKTTQGDVLIDVQRDWAPLAADRFYNLVKIGYLQDVAFFRVVDGFMAQAGIHADPAVNEVWGKASIKDEPVKQENTRGMVSFASAGKDTRSNQFFISFGDNRRLDAMGFAPFGKVRNMEVVDKLHAGYGEGPPYGKGPNQGKMQREGGGYLKAEFPKLDYIVSASIEAP